jgi:isopenicillin-N epimerase
VIDRPAAPLSDYALDPGMVHVNHGSFGACPRVVLATQQALRERLEAAPTRFFVVEWEGLLDAARERVAAFVGADPAGLVFVPNTTTAVSTVLASLALTAGDELLVTDHTYGACKNAIDATAGIRTASPPRSSPPSPIGPASRSSTTC